MKNKDINEQVVAQTTEIHNSKYQHERELQRQQFDAAGRLMEARSRELELQAALSEKSEKCWEMQSRIISLSEDNRMLLAQNKDVLSNSENLRRTNEGLESHRKPRSRGDVDPI